MLKRLFKFGYITSLISFQDLINSCSVDLFQCLHHMLSCYESRSDRLSIRPRGHNYILPTCRQSSINRTLFDFVWKSAILCLSVWFCLVCLQLLTLLGISFYRAMHFSAKRGIAIACRLSVRPSVCLSACLSVTLVNCDHIGCNSSKIISSSVSLGCSLFATPTW